MILVVRDAVEDYGATHDVELVVVPGTWRGNNCTHSQQPSRHAPSWRTKKVLCTGSIIGMTAAVASSAFLLFLSVQASSSGPALTGESFLLQATNRADDGKCVVASGPWPTGSVSTDDDLDDGLTDRPYVTCFSSPYHHCWSHSYYDSSGDWKPCTPNGFGKEWVFDSPSDDDGPWPFDGHVKLHQVESCGTPCTEFSKDMPHN